MLAFFGLMHFARAYRINSGAGKRQAFEQLPRISFAPELWEALERDVPFFCECDHLRDHFRVMDPTQFAPFCAYADPLSDDPEKLSNDCEGTLKLEGIDREAMRSVLKAIYEVMEERRKAGVLPNERRLSLPKGVSTEPGSPEPEPVSSEHVSSEPVSSESAVLPRRKYSRKNGSTSAAGTSELPSTSYVELDE